MAGNKKKDRTKLKARIIITLLVISSIMAGICSVPILGSRDRYASNVNLEEGLPQAAKDALQKLEADCIIVLGCPTKDDGTVSEALKSRLDMGIYLYKEGYAPKLLLSGANGQDGATKEVQAMFDYCLVNGVPRADIFVDGEGVSTFDSIYRMGYVFMADKAIIVTQNYHMPRAVYIGVELGMNCLGVSCDQAKNSGTFKMQAREYLARGKDFIKTAGYSLGLGKSYEGEIIRLTGDGMITQNF